MYNYQIIEENNEYVMKYSDTDKGRIVVVGDIIKFRNADGKTETLAWDCWAKGDNYYKGHLFLQKAAELLALRTGKLVPSKNVDTVLEQQINIIKLEADMKAQKLKVAAAKQRLATSQKAGTIE